LIRADRQIDIMDIYFIHMWIQWSIFDMHTNVFLYLHSCVLLLKQE
jgi:hypothetical protein